MHANTYRLGWVQDPWLLPLQIAAQQSLEARGWTLDIVPLPTDSPLESSDVLSTALTENHIHLAVQALSDQPTTPPIEIARAAVLPRQSAATVLVFARRAADSSQPLGLAHAARLGVFTPLEAAQFQALRPDVELHQVSRTTAPTAAIYSGTLDALLLPDYLDQSTDNNAADLNRQPLADAEWVTAPAQGMAVIEVSADNLALRSALRSVHQAEVSRIVNVERNVLRQLNYTPQSGRVGAWCKTDLQGYYHAAAAFLAEKGDDLRVARHSSSTTGDLAQALLSQLRP